MKKLTASSEDYLEAIYLLEKNNVKIKSVDIANNLHISKPGVNKALNILKNLEYIDKKDYGEVFLTPKGRERALEIYSYHQTIFIFLQKLGVSNEVAEIDCCKIEHVISNETYEMIKKFIEKNT